MISLDFVTDDQLALLANMFASLFFALCVLYTVAVEGDKVPAAVVAAASTSS
ncbi:hypothetical protein AMAG_20297 [Allomyces macrogynus ATCC 38327]|uniref:Uncharacterized protein n=1 Tax=Allomyces macrogynus (strain ATCC 38327) TaxID=578462 RepID=A0A0L0T7T4_ALLM3|nr:hypothetical protein AMAG_20297 [Allomyces macrogynus ATCC 38327]|eukprot:KNE70614.1 hypothetical protein AMAG_20297 [Allomyces macrogynus ATCC 38327]